MRNLLDIKATRMHILLKCVATKMSISWDDYSNITGEQNTGCVLLKDQVVQCMPSAGAKK